MNFYEDLDLCAKVEIATPHTASISTKRFITEAAKDFLIAISHGNPIHFTYDWGTDSSGTYANKVAIMQYSYSFDTKSDKRFIAAGEELSQYMNKKVFEAVYIYLQLKCSKCGYSVANNYSRGIGTPIYCEPVDMRARGLSVDQLVTLPEYSIYPDEYSQLNDLILRDYINQCQHHSKTSTSKAQSNTFGTSTTGMFG